MKSVLIWSLVFLAGNAMAIDTSVQPPCPLKAHQELFSTTKSVALAAQQQPVVVAPKLSKQKNGFSEGSNSSQTN